VAATKAIGRRPALGPGLLKFGVSRSGSDAAPAGVPVQTGRVEDALGHYGQLFRSDRPDRRTAGESATVHCEDVAGIIDEVRNNVSTLGPCPRVSACDRNAESSRQGHADRHQTDREKEDL